MKLTTDVLRKRAATHSLFTVASIVDAVTRLGIVQADPIQAPARAQDLILRQRIEGYRVGDLERGYKDAGLDEDVLQCYGTMPSAHVSLMLPRPRVWHIEREHPALAEQILAFVQRNGHTSHRDLEQHFGSARTRGGWGTQAKVTTLMLDLLHHRGHLRVAHRQGNERFYVIAEREATILSADERLRKLVLLLVNLYAPVSLPTARRLVSHLGYAAPTLDGRLTIVKRMVESGELATATVDGVPYFWPSNAPFDRRVDGEVRLLAPFDPVVHDRERFEHLWGWPYRFEAYTPPVKRKWGYYALPMLWRDRVVGWANVTVREGHMQAEVGFVAGRPAERGFGKALARELARMEAFL